MVTPEGETKTITCTITVIGSFTALTAAESVASSYNSYFNLSESDEGYAKTAVNGEDSAYYTIVSSLSSFATLSDAKSFVISNLVPEGFSATQSNWGSGALPDGTKTNYITYSIYDRKTTTTVNLTFAIYEDSEGKFALKVTSIQF